MDRGNVLSGAAFTAVLQSAVVFLVVLITVGFLTNSYVERTMTGELREDIQARWSLFAADYRDEGIEPLMELIDNAASFSAQGQRAIGLFDADGKSVAGNILARPKADGWHHGALDLVPIASQTPADEHDIDYFYRSDRVDDYTVVVGQRLDRMFLTDRTVFRTLSITGFIVVLAMLSAGYLLSRESLHKLERLEKALQRVSDGDMSARIAVSPHNDQIDRIAGRMNTHLDSLSQLMSSTRSTAAAVAHDLKSPLARAYLGLGRALAQVDAGNDPRAEIEDTQAELEQMSAIFNTFMRLARIESGADGVKFAKVDLRGLVDDLAETYQLIAEDQGQTLIYDRAAGDTMTVMGDSAMLQQLVVNLLENALKHGGEGNEIRLSLDRGAERARLTIADRGPGIPEAARAAVFEPFYRLDPSRRKPGSGLGLALVSAIAARHQADITLADNNPGLRVSVTFSQ
ncbi:sensor histidine kinase [Roseovarius arcticus]|uniref:sensor histidine kinase n=1 Tax=Roseovarius arcticus TaxID=2547404 RepID=UPI001110184C|nr:HAMP domain-containing sensor histidine kinase [Roseovarius arcticus]